MQKSLGRLGELPFSFQLTVRLTETKNGVVKKISCTSIGAIKSANKEGKTDD